MKVRVTAKLIIDEVVDYDEDITDDEIYDDLWDYMCQKIDWHWEKVNLSEIPTS